LKRGKKYLEKVKEIDRMIKAYHIKHNTELKQIFGVDHV